MTGVRVWISSAVAVLAGLLLATFLAPTAAHASGDMWTGKGDGHTWGDGMNWASMTAPQDGDDVTIAPPSPGQFPSVTGLPGGMNLGDLTLTDASLSGGDATVTGTFTWDVSTASARTLAAQLTITGDATITGTGLKLVQSTVTFSGNTDVAGTGLLEPEFSGGITNAGDFTIKAGATVEANSCCSNPNKFINTGTVSVPSGTGTLGFVDFRNHGSVSVGPGGRLNVPSGFVEMSGGDHVGGGGTLTFEHGAEVTMANNVSVGAGTTIHLGHEAALLGTGSLGGAGKFSWTGGNVSGNISVARTITTTISGTETKFVSAPGSKKVTLALNGPTTLTGTGELETHLGNITSSGRFQIDTGSTLGANSCCAAPDRFTSTGTLAVPASKSGTATVQFIDFSDQGTVSVGKGSTLHVVSGPAELASGNAINGAGTLEFDKNAAVTLANNVTIGATATLALTGGATFGGTGSLAGTGRFAWTGGGIGGNLTVGKTVGTAISGTAAKVLQRPTGKLVTLTLNGTTTVTGKGPVALGGLATLNNKGTLKLSGGTTISGNTADHLTSSGTLLVTARKSTATVGNGLPLASTGTVRIASGKLAVTGDYIQATTGTLATTITGTTPGAKFGQLVVSGTAKLAGTLHVTTGGGFKPKKGQSFAVVSCRARKGKFGKHTGKPAYKVTYAAKSVKAVY
jgi:fibronectin-binding autotransporter adhesin